MSFGLQPDYRQKIFSMLQQQGSPEPAQNSSREIFFSIQEKVKPRPEQARLEPVRQLESRLSGNGTALADRAASDFGQKSGRETADDEPGILDRHTDKTALGAHPEEAQKKETGSAEARFAIQAVACRKRANAESLAEELRKKGYRTTVYPDQHLDGSNWFKVRVGAYATREEAEKALRDYQKETNPKAFTIKLDDIQSP
ncbi:MAG: SPOR domain-containing protein [Thermodesulfobacteriota bacterium]